MGYQIQYGATMQKTHIPERRKFRLTWKGLTILFAAPLILLAIYFGRQEAVQNFFLPGNSQVTRGAISELVSDLKDGKSFSDSVEAFCREIVEGANVPN